MLVRPVAPEQITGIEIDNVVGENERRVRLGPRAHELMLLAESEDVVPKNVFFSVVLMESSALATVNDIVLQHDAGAALVSIQSPTAIIERIHIMDQVVAHHRSGLWPKCVNAAHIAEPSFPDVVHMIELDNIRAAR